MSDEVSQFLEQVERLRGQQIEDDAARAREREEFLAAKRERQARREERARSISPQKSSPLNTPSPRANRQSVWASDAARLGSPDRTWQDREPSATSSLDPDDPMSPRSLSTKEREASVEAETVQTESSTPPTRTPTLSWQRRPASRGGARPLSMVAAQNATQRSLTHTQGATSVTEESLSKDQVARALGFEDQSWLRQNADRAQGSAARRRNQTEAEDRSDMSSVRAQLPGTSIVNAVVKNESRPKLNLEESQHRKLASPVTFNLSPFDGAAEDIHRTQEPSTASGMASSTRSPSPTKGLGGFVQSAMMKRSDSVKRWSVSSPPGLTRADSVAATRGNYDRLSVQMSSRQHNTTREGPTTPTSSRPTSRHGDNPSHQGSGENVSHDSERDEIAGTPTSPSKTMDVRRWSPTKSSWLESALNRPESPKPAPSPTQATWRGKAAMESNRPTSISPKHQVNIGGLLRQSALGSVAKSNPTGLGGIYSPPPNANRPAYGHGSKTSISQKQSEPGMPHTEPGMPLGKAQDVIERSTVADPAKPTPTTSPPPVKPKPQTPATTDLRSNLRQRAADKEVPKSNEPEFKNVFGNLRRTKTQNYVAPDELKDNILRGKAGLSITDGPKKSERKDEFKDAILKKKADFKTAQAEGRGVTRTASNTVEKPIPEGLAKRAELASKSVATTAKKNSLSETPTSSAFKKIDSPKPIPGPKRVPSGSAFSPRSPNTTKPPPLTRSPSTERLRRVSTGPQATKGKDGGTRASPSLHKETSAPSKLSTQGRVGAGSGRLANRFNPTLAGLLAKGPPGMSTNVERGADEPGEPISSGAGASTETKPSVSVPRLTHMTKNRARGPRRNTPTSSTATTAPATTACPGQVANPSTSATTSEKAPQVTGVEHELPAGRPHAEKTDVDANHPSQRKSASLSIQQPVTPKAYLQGNPSTDPTCKATFTEPVGTSEPAARARSVSSVSQEQPQAMGLREAIPTSPTANDPQNESKDAPPVSPNKLDVKRMSRFLGEAPLEQVSLRQQQTGSSSPTKVAEPPSPTKSDRDSLPSMRDASPRFRLRSQPLVKPSLDERTTADVLKRQSKPLSGSSAEDLKTPAAMALPAHSPTKQTNEVSAIFSDFFGTPQTRRALKSDAAQILMNRPETGDKVTSLGVQMFQILGDGKKLPVAPQNERVLFDQEMYVCAHKFATTSGRKVFEVHFWVGDEVPQSSAEDAQLFVQREARSLGGKLVKLRQGKETAEFVQALGGVIIVRKGSSNKYDSLAPSMLCGRRYLGQVAFDQVDYSPSSLCAGFTYLLTKGGNCYMWKGKGSDVTEVSCARLIGMDLTLTGELIEFEDGLEPASFWELFEDKVSRPHSADHWRLKPSYDKYCSRLFCSDADSRQQIFEISPFNQADLSPSSIYMLDAFFEIYVIVGSRANSQYSSFRNALDFAQEYAILASGMEDRPFVPISTVVLEGIPRDLKRVFRKWDDDKSPTVTNPAGSGPGLKRGRSLRVVPLTQALQALAD